MRKEYKMIGKRIRISDYKFTYGQETVYINVFGVFKNIKSGNKYIVYSYDNKKLYFGSFFVKDNIGTVMVSKDTDKDIIKNFIDNVISGNNDNSYEIENLDSIQSIQIIDELIYDYSVDINKLDEITMPKEKIEEVKETPKKKVSLFVIGIMVLLIVIGVFFFVNPEVINGKNIIYSCDKNYRHNELPATINENRIVTFNSKGIIMSIDINTDYVFNDIDYYNEFKNKSYFYKYVEEADTYKFNDTNYTYRVFSKIDVNTDYFLPDNKEELISYFENDGYNCKIKEE